MTTHNHEPAAGSPANHDPILISAHAAGDLAGRDLATAQALLAGCDDCRALHADLRAIASAVRDLPAPARAGARDFRIPPERAAALARGSLWRRFLRPFGRPGTASRPLALAFTTLGVAGLLLAALPSVPPGTGDQLRAMTPETTDSRNAAQATVESDLAAPEATPAPDRAAPDASPPGDTLGGATEYQSGAGGASGAGPTAQPTTGDVVALAETPLPADGSEAPSPLVLLSVAFLAGGLSLVLLRVAALRVR